MSKPPEVSRPPPSRPLTVTPTITLIDVVNPNVTLSNSSSEGVTSNLASYEGNKVSDLSTAIGPESQPDNAISPAVGLSLEEKDDEDGYISLEGGSDAAVKIQRVRSESKGGDGEKGKKNEGDFDVGKKPENNSAELKMVKDHNQSFCHCIF